MKIQYSRLLVCVCATGMLLAPLLAPSLPQVKRYLTFSTRMHGSNDLKRFESTVLLNFTGTHFPVHNKYAGKELYFSSGTTWRKCLVLAVLATMIAAVATAVFILLRERGSPLLVMFATLPLSLVPSWIQTSLSGNDLKPQYVLSPIPGICALVAVGLCLWVRRDPRHTAAFKNSPLFACAIPGILMAVWMICNWPQMKWMMKHPTENLRASVELARGADGIHYRGPTNIYTMNLWRRPTAYDPRCYAKPMLGNELDALIKKVQRERGELWVTIGYSDMTKLLQPEIWERISNRELFEFHSMVPGFFPLANLRIYRLRTPDRTPSTASATSYRK